MLREISSGRGEGPSYMKIPYIEFSFQVTSNHHCTIYGVGGCSELRERYENAFICICTSVCMCVLSRSLKTLYGIFEEEGVYGKFSFLVFIDFGVEAKFEQKMKSVC